MNLLLSVSEWKHSVRPMDDSRGMISHLLLFSSFFKQFSNAIDSFYANHTETALLIQKFEKCSQSFRTIDENIFTQAENFSSITLEQVHKGYQHGVGSRAYAVLDKLCSFSSEVMNQDAVEERKKPIMEKFEMLEATLYSFRCTLPMFTWLLSVLSFCLLPSVDIASSAHVVDFIFMSHEQQIAENRIALSDIIGMEAFSALECPLSCQQASISSKGMIVWYATLCALKCKVKNIPCEAKRIRTSIHAHLQLPQTRTDLKQIYFKISELVFDSFSQELNAFKEKLKHEFPLLATHVRF